MVYSAEICHSKIAADIWQILILDLELQQLINLGII